MDAQFSRLALLIGEAGIRKLSCCRVAVFGLGGVGCYAAETLCRSGVGGFTLIDGDSYELTNLNRQLYALHSTLGRPKADAAKERLLDINPAAAVTAHTLFYLPETAGSVALTGCDYIVDAVDTVAAKLAIAEQGLALGIPVISAMGAGNKHGTSFEAADIYETSVCPLCRVMRRELRNRGIGSLRVVYSKEPPARVGEVVGSTAFAPAACGLVLAREVISALLKV